MRPVAVVKNVFCISFYDRMEHLKVLVNSNFNTSSETEEGKTTTHKTVDNPLFVRPGLEVGAYKRLLSGLPILYKMGDTPTPILLTEIQISFGCKSEFSDLLRE